MTEQHRNPVPVEEARIRDLKLHQRWYSRTGAWAFKKELFDEAVLLFRRAGEAQSQLRASSQCHSRVALNATATFDRGESEDPQNTYLPEGRREI